MPGIAVGCVPLDFSYSMQDVANLTGCNDLVSAFSSVSSLLVHLMNPLDDGSLKKWKSSYRNVYSGSLTTYTQTVTVLPYNNKRVLVLTIGSNAVRIGAAPSLNGVSFTRAGSNQGSYSTEIWYIIDPPVGTFTLIIPKTGGNYFWLFLEAFPYINSASLYSTNFAAGSARYAPLYASAPSGQSSFLISIIIADATSGGQSIDSDTPDWFGIHATYLGNFDQGGSVTLLTGALTQTFDIAIARSWECSNAVFSIS